MGKSQSLIRGLVIGSRKAGTTWLYENFKKDDRFSVSKHVKESGFFSGRIGEKALEYEQLWPDGDLGYRVEVDTSICSAVDSADRIYRYNEEMKLVLILRDPVQFLMSRFTHGLRKGEFKSESIADAFEETPMFRQELDYPGMVSRYNCFAERGNMRVIRYSDLQEHPLAFYDHVTHALGVTDETDYSPFLNTVNEARNSNYPKISKLLSDAAVVARKYGFHEIVNVAKSTGFHGKLEEKRGKDESNNMYHEAEKIIHRFFPDTHNYYNALGKYDGK